MVDNVVDLSPEIIDTYAGNGGLGFYGGDRGPAAEAFLFQPCDLAFGPDGAIYTADPYNHCIRVARL